MHLKLAILSISFITVMSGAAVAPALSSISEYFSNVPLTTVKLVITLPAIFIMGSAILTKKFANRFSAKKLLLVAILMYAASGVLAGFAPNIYTLLFFRATLGLAVGVLMPMSNGLIAEFFVKDERAKMMGLSAAASQLGGVVTVLISGMLADINWRIAFGIYSLALVTFFLNYKYLEEPEKMPVKGGLKNKPALMVYFWAFCAFMQMVFFYTVPTNISFFIKSLNLGGTSMTGVIISIAIFSAFISGLSFSRVLRLLGRFYPVFAITISITGFMALSFADSGFKAAGAVVFIGSSMGFTMPYIYLSTANSSKGEHVGSMAIVSVFLFAGQFLSPVIVDGMAHMLNITSITSVFRMLSFTLMPIMAAVFLLVLVKGKVCEEEVEG